ncbi:MAG: DUF1343 domain-containing protein [Gemmatimonadota bacterium]|nr:DUF1343 domain-containing protein [Gemmatimonadota bacterium]
MAPVTAVPRMVRFGVDGLLADRARCGAARRIGMVTNDAARPAADPSLPSRVALRAAGVPLVRLFGPEHGLQRTAADGASVEDGRDAFTGLPVVSLYGARMRPTAAQLGDLDLVLFDVPDVGARFYTYTWTLYHLLAACEAAGVPVMVLDRPNPLGGVLGAAEGPVMDADCRSFVGEDAIPVRHGLTLGELARLWQRERFPQVALDVVPCRGWRTGAAWPATGVPWVPTSPAMPTFASAVWYPGLCLFEATNLSVGRGTTMPFQWVGAPWLDAAAVVAELSALGLPGARFVVATATPTSQHAGVPCQGVRVLVDDGQGGADDGTAAPLAEMVARSIRPVALGLHLLRVIADRHPTAFAWAGYPTAANPSGGDHFARLIGHRAVASSLLGLDEVEARVRVAAWTGVGDWGVRVAPVLIYER